MATAVSWKLLVAAVPGSLSLQRAAERRGGAARRGARGSAAACARAPGPGPAGPRGARAQIRLKTQK